MAFPCAFSSFSKPPNGSKNTQKTEKKTNLFITPVCKRHEESVLPKIKSSVIFLRKTTILFLNITVPLLSFALPFLPFIFLAFPDLTFHNLRGLYCFLQDDFYVEYVQKLKKSKNVLSNLVEDPLEGWNMVNAILRFGIEYHFQEEIETILKRQYVIFNAHELENLIN